MTLEKHFKIVYCRRFLAEMIHEIRIIMKNKTRSLYLVKSSSTHTSYIHDLGSSKNHM